MKSPSSEQLSEEKSSATSLQLSHRALSDVSSLKGFTNLERLDLSCNKLTTLEGLESCINLKWLSVVQNKLQSLKGIEGLTKLMVLNAGRNNLRSMDEVKSLVSVGALILNDNDITSICRLDQLTCLNTLVLSRNPIHDIGDSLVKVKSIRKLSLANCRVHTIGSSVISCTDLKELRLAHNEITILPAELARNVKIQNLDLGNNLIRHWSDLKVLSSLHILKNLNLQGNPIAEKDKLVRKIKTLVPNLHIFNGKPIERGNMKEIAKKALSSHSKNDYSPDIAADLETVKQVKKKEVHAKDKVKQSAKRNNKDDVVPESTTDVAKEVKSEVISKKNVSGNSKDDNLPNLPNNATDDVKRKIKKRKEKNVGKSKLEGIDDGETPFVELILSEGSKNSEDSHRKKRDQKTVQDSGLVKVYSKKKKTDNQLRTGHSALQFLLPTSEIGMGGPSTWDD